MNSRTTSERALVLRITPSGESFRKIDLLTKETGYLLSLQRISKKNPSSITPDIFDSADVLLERSHQGTTYFVKDYHLVQHRRDIGQSYRKLQYACEFCTLIVNNAAHMADPALIYETTERTLNAFAEKELPEIVSLKTLYLLLKDEGYPVRESWWPQLPQYLKETARQLINEPSPENISKEQHEDCLKVTQSLRNWLTLETDLTLP